MHIEKLSLINFKNYEEVDLTFSNKVNSILGLNGSGKTNLLDAIYYLSATKSAFNAIDTQNVKFEEKFFTIKGALNLGDKPFNIQCVLQEGQKKIIKVNGVEYDKLREHIGRFPVIFMAPNDSDLIRDGSEIRRKFLDQLISQTDRPYLDNLIEYNHYLKQRNSLLKRFADTNKIDDLLLEPYNIKLITLGSLIYKKREEFISTFKSHFLKQFENIAGAKETVDIIYQSDFSTENYEKAFLQQFKKDLILQRTTFGVHKDDLKFQISNKPLKKFGSQGQQKSFVVALKLAHYFMIKEIKGFKPILLLDDIFDKLDAKRIEKLIKLMIKDEFGQVFITDARTERTKELLKATEIKGTFYEISEGKLSAAYEE